jgi:DNA-directed RNA polymerase specialized sigma24 family protein
MNINDKIEGALQNKDIVNIMNKACKKFVTQLDSDVLNSCKLNALWKCFMYFKPEKNTKFTTYLYNGVFIECLKEIKFKNKYQKFSGKLHENIVKNSDPYLMIDLMDELKSDEEKELFLDRLSNMTIEEMAKKRQSNRETTRKKLNKMIQNMRKRVNKSV